MLSVIAFFVVYALQAAYFILSLKKCLVECRDQHVIALSIAQCCVSLTVPISLYHCYEHLSCFTKPRLQSQIVRIICMVPVYSLEGMLSISYPEAAFYLQVGREGYEGFVIYSFMIYLLNFLTDQYPDLALVLSDKPASIGHHKHPFCFLPPWRMGKEFLGNCKAGVFQYVLVRCVLTAVSVPGFMLGYYVEGVYSISSLYTWMIGISCVSQMFALYSLFLFYHALHEEIYVLRPFAKFVCIKIVVFFSWFQGVAIDVLVQLGHISEMREKENDHSGHSVQEVAAGIQDLLICMEMFLAAIAFYNSFPVSEFSPHKLERDSILRRRKTSSDASSTSSVQQSGPALIPSAVPDAIGPPSSGSVSPVTDTDSIVHISEIVETDDEEQMLLFPVVNRRLDLRERMRTASGEPRTFPVISFWGHILQLIGGGEIVKRKIDDPYNDDDNMSEFSGPTATAAPAAEVIVQQTTLRRDAILTPSKILGEYYPTGNDNRSNDEADIPRWSNLINIRTPAHEGGASTSTLHRSVGSSTPRSPVALLPTPYRSQYRWRSGRDPLHQRSGDSISRGGLAVDTASGDGGEGWAKPRATIGEPFCSRLGSCLTLGYVPGLCNCWLKWTFGRNELESIWGSCVHYYRMVLKYCDGYRAGPSKNDREHYNNNGGCLGNHGIYSTSLVLPALWTVLVPVELLQDFSDTWKLFWTCTMSIPRQVQRWCARKSERH